MQTGQPAAQQSAQEQQVAILAPEIKSRPPREAASLLAEYPPAIIAAVLMRLLPAVTLGELRPGREKAPVMKEALPGLLNGTLPGLAAMVIR